MGMILKRIEFRQQYPEFQQGLFLVQSEKRFPKDQPIVNLGRTISSQLLNCPQEKRRDEALQILRDSVANKKAVSVNRINLLFSEYLALDVLRELLSIARNRKICVLWPGDFQNGMLTYAEPGSREYYECKLSEMNNLYYIEE